MFETGKYAAVDEQGNTWTLDKTWKRDYIPTEKFIDGVTQNGIDRNNAWFNTYKQGQILLAKELLEQNCQFCKEKNIFAKKQNNL